AAVVQYLRPEIIGFVLGSLAAALAFKDFRPRTGSAPFVRFVLGVFAMIGALVFLGCPWRALLRLAGGDLNAILGLAGLIFGIWLGTLFLKNGYNLGRTQKTHAAAGHRLAQPGDVQTSGYGKKTNFDCRCRVHVCRQNERGCLFL
ncbi:MAG: hypothetical protein ABR534_16520, partial [Desulfotignum sp.]